MKKTPKHSVPLNLIPVPTLLVETEGWTILEANPNATELLGLSGDKKKKLDQLVSAEGRDYLTHLKEMTAYLATGDLIEDQLHFLKKINGRKLSCHVAITLVSRKNDVAQLLLNLIEVRTRDYLLVLRSMAKVINSTDEQLGRALRLLRGGERISSVDVARPLTKIEGEVAHLKKILGKKIFSDLT